MTVDNANGAYLGSTETTSSMNYVVLKQWNEFLMNNTNPPAQQRFAKRFDLAPVMNTAATALLETVVINKENIIDWAIVDFDASSPFLGTDAQLQIYVLPQSP